MGTDPRDAPGAPDEESFVGRWSRRKREACTEPDSPALTGAHASVTPEPAHAPEEPTAAAAVRPDGTEAVLTDADMPPLESLDASSDWSGFLSPGVSHELRRTALRKLFHLPEFNIRDGLNDYDDDFTTFEALGDIVTADMRHQIEREQARAAAQAEAEAEAQAAEERGAVAQAGETQSDAAVDDREGDAAIDVQGAQGAQLTQQPAAAPACREADGAGERSDIEARRPAGSAQQEESG